jgi:hypothetical protein
MSYVKLEMFTRARVIGRILQTKTEADSQNFQLKKARSAYRWVATFDEIAKFEEEERARNKK